jgi:hypothetical protein
VAQAAAPGNWVKWADGRRGLDLPRYAHAAEGAAAEVRELNLGDL